MAPVTPPSSGDGSQDHEASSNSASTDTFSDSYEGNKENAQPTSPFQPRQLRRPITEQEEDGNDHDDDEEEEDEGQSEQGLQEQEAQNHDLLDIPPVTRSPSIDPDTGPYIVFPNFAGILAVAYVSNKRKNELRLEYYGDDAESVKEYKKNSTPDEYRFKAAKRHGGKTFEMWRNEIGRFPGDDDSGLRGGTSSMESMAVRSRSRSRTPEDEGQIQREFKQEVLHEVADQGEPSNANIARKRSRVDEDIAQKDEEDEEDAMPPPPPTKRARTRARPQNRTNSGGDEPVRRSSRLQSHGQLASSNDPGSSSQHQSQTQNGSRKKTVQRNRRPPRQRQQQIQPEDLRRSSRSRKPPDRYVPQLW